MSISISPATATVGPGGSQSITATVSNASNTAVAWTSTGGSISGSGKTVTWLAPSTPGTYRVTATSMADPSKSATATFTVSPSVSISISPTSGSVAAGGSQTLTARREQRQ